MVTIIHAMDLDTKIINVDLEWMEGILFRRISHVTIAVDLDTLPSFVEVEIQG